MKGLWIIVVALGGGALACSPNTGGQGTGGGGQPGGNDDGTSTGGDDNTGPQISDGVGDASGSATQGGSATGTTTDDPVTTDPADTTDGTDPGSTTMGDDEGQESSTTDEPPPQQELLEHADFASCGLPVWCLDGDGFPVTQDMWMQQCFSATLEPPFALTELELRVDEIFGNLSGFEVEVYAYNPAAGGPGDFPLASQSHPPGDLNVGLNTITLDPPLMIEQQDICIGVRSDGIGSGALGVSLSMTHVPNTSYFQLFTGGGGACDLPDWVNHTGLDLNGFTPGNWCIRGTIVEQ